MSPQDTDTHALNVFQISGSRAASRHINYLYMRESNAHEINATKNLDGKVSSRPIKCLYMKESHTHAINVTIKLIVKVTSIVLQNSFGNKHCQHQNWFYFPKWS